MTSLRSLVASGFASLQNLATGSYDQCETTNPTLIESEPCDTSAALPEPPASDTVTPDATSSLVAREMFSLSCHDRERVYSDVHGVSETIRETPELLSDRLPQMEVELNRLADKDAYDLAYSKNPSYVQDAKFRLRFLRADRFDARLAAIRLARHFQTKLELFGEDKLVKDIVQDDFDADTMDALYSGFSQYTRFRDCANRRLVVNMPHPSCYSSLAKLRRSFYMIMVSTEDEDVQKNGVVGVGYTVGQRPSQGMDYGFLWKWARLNRSMPVRLEAVHFFHDSTLWGMCFAFFRLSLGHFTRLRIRDHKVKNRDECVHILHRFGIPITDDFPVTSDGRLSAKWHEEFYEARRNMERLQLVGTLSGTQPASQADTNLNRVGVTKETKATPAVRVGVPGPRDVLLGRGRTNYEHDGNVSLRSVIESRSMDYDVAPSFTAKQNISGEIVVSIQQAGGRFLNKDAESGDWIQIDDAAARRKVAHTFRTLRVARLAANGSSTKANVRKNAKRCQANDASDSLGSAMARPAKKARTVSPHMAGSHCDSVTGGTTARYHDHAEI